MLNITHYQRNANQKTCRSEWLLSKSLQIINAGEGVEKSNDCVPTSGGYLLILNLLTLHHISRILVGGFPYAIANTKNYHQGDGRKDGDIYPPRNGGLYHIGL